MKDVSNLIQFFYKLNDVEDSVILEINSDKNKAIIAKLNSKIELHQDVIKRAVGVRNAVRLFEYCKIPEDMKFLLEDIQNQFEDIQILSKIIEPKHFELNLDGSFESLPDKNLEGAETVFIHSVKLSFRDKYLWAIVSCRGTTEVVDRDGKNYKFTSSDNVIEDYQLWDGDNENPPRTVTQVLPDIKKNMKGSTTELSSNRD
ncbi:MAG: hypothetical protein U5J63_04985 [Fodinibius sp.]|nr:hypothetical protein [Fodinibius sp.]